MASRYYEPYISSDSESDSGSDTESEYTSSDGESIVSGPGSDTPTLVMRDGIPKEIDYEESGAKLVTGSEQFNESRNTTLIMLSSRDRDTNVYTQPTFFTMRLPRTFKNVKTIAITQLSLLNSFFNFSESIKGNTVLYVNEFERTIYDAESQSTIRNDVRVNIRDGTYNANELVNELNNALNQTPLFADISFPDFLTQFQGTGAYSLLFNTPGPVVYDSLTDQYEANVTMSQLVSRYFQSIQTVGTVSYSYSQCRAAYYYPIIKEITTRNKNQVLPFNSYPDSPYLQGQEPYTYIVFLFTGLDDPYIQQLLNDPENIVLFDQYHFDNTFNKFLVNQYNCTYNSLQGRLRIAATSLNPSIQADLTTQYQEILNEQVFAAGFTSVEDFYSQYNQIEIKNAALLEFYNFIHTQFTKVFGINFGTYSDKFFSDLTNELTLYNTVDKLGWNTFQTSNVVSVNTSTKTDPQVSTLFSGIIVRDDDPYSASFLQELPMQSTLQFSNASETTFGYTDISFSILPTTYARMKFTSRCRQTLSIMTLPRYLNERGPGTEESYPTLGSNLGETPFLYDTCNAPDVYIRTDISGASDFYLYTVEQVMFTSRDYMRDEERWLTYIQPQILGGIRVQQSSPDYGVSPPISDMSLVTSRPHMFFEVRMAGYFLDPNAKWKVDIVVETRTGANFTGPLTVARYRDRSAFMSDIRKDLAIDYNEDPRLVFERQVFRDVSTAVLTIDVLNSESSYIMVHMDNRDVGTIPVRVYALLHDEYGVYTEANQLDRRQMPWKNLSTLVDQYTPNSDVFNFPLSSIYNKYVTQIGYDSKEVSNNLLDYVIQASDNIFFDPRNIGPSTTGLRYNFNFKTNGIQSPTPDTTNWSLYFGSGSSNIVFDTGFTDLRKYYITSSNTLTRYDRPIGQENEAVSVNWFKPGAENQVEEYFTPVPGGVPSPSTFIGTSNTSFIVCRNPIVAPTDVSTSSVFQDTTGFSGLSFFLKPNDIVKLNDIQLKFVYIQPTETPSNTNITRGTPILSLTNTTGYKFQNAVAKPIYDPLDTTGGVVWDDWYYLNRQNIRIGVFETARIVSTNVNTLSLSNALCTLTLDKVTQVANYTNATGTSRARNPDWGTYYTYKVQSSNTDVWTYSPSGPTPWDIVSIGPDTTPTYIAGNQTYPGYFLTHTTIHNNNSLPRSYGIAPSVGHSVNNPYSYVSSYTADIPNSYTVVPFYYDTSVGDFRTGSFYGVSFTRSPCVPDPVKAGAAPYIGPPGIFGWTRQVSTMVLANGDRPSFQPYYWNAKIGYQTLDKQYDPATDLTAFGGFAGISGELQDTMLFFYENKTTDHDDMDDISSITTVSLKNYWKWGQEQNTVYRRVDDQSGYNYLSYITNIGVKNSTIHDYAVHVRGYVPTSKFNTGLRIIGKNFTDFGSVSLSELAKEVSDINGYTPITPDLAYKLAMSTSSAYYSTIIHTNDTIRYANGNYYSHQYADALATFNNLFIYPTGITFGKRIGIAGEVFFLNGYQDAIQQYSDYYLSLVGSRETYVNVLSTSTGLLNQYILDKYGNILPELVLQRTRITDPIPFSILFKSKLMSPYDTQFDEWGLGWNLGFPKQDTSYRITQISDTFIRITQDYIYLRLNPEMNLNMMGVSAKEDLSLTREPFAEDGKYFAKILLNNFGGISRSAVFMPKNFDPILGKYDTISLELVDRNGVRIDNTDCEYDLTLEVAEIADGARSAYAIKRGR